MCDTGTFIHTNIQFLMFLFFVLYHLCLVETFKARKFSMEFSGGSCLVQGYLGVLLEAPGIFFPVLIYAPFDHPVTSGLPPPPPPGTTLASVWYYNKGAMTSVERTFGWLHRKPFCILETQQFTHSTGFAKSKNKNSNNNNNKLSLPSFQFEFSNTKLHCLSVRL